MRGHTPPPAEKSALPGIVFVAAVLSLFWGSVGFFLGMHTEGQTTDRAIAALEECVG